MAKNNNINTNAIYGKHAVLLACNKRNPQDIKRIVLLKREDKALFSKELQQKIEIISAIEMVKITPNHGGFICFTREIQTIFEEDLHGMKSIIALDCVQDVGNIGAIIRTAAAFGVEALVYTTDKMPSVANNGAVSKASSGGVELVKLCPVINLNRTLENLKQQGFWVFGADMNGTNIQTIAQKYKNDKKILVLGNEESGMRQGVKASCDEIVSIPINSEIESLNVSVAGGVLMYTLFCG